MKTLRQFIAGKNKPIATIAPEETVLRALELMAKHDVGALLDRAHEIRRREGVVDDEREDENRQQDGHGPLGDALGDGVRLRRHERARGRGGGGVTDSLLHGFLADPAWRRSSVDRSF